ncbi:hypothetical protein Fsol_00196 [Candidatus Fokinia solitaria]|uniref:Uncharacterized protein n=1 Tax=Candidatus Fokinia solitaria TaxID=1802984 RepID=A0A2U8BRV3_9RICK|nr:hypothetical protein [Candidatus Fokinia solitaria]AWD33000.1 hypothetical protein Fsol_00196 [Candidatus Fokinia solitaria]
MYEKISEISNRICAILFKNITAAVNDDSGEQVCYIASIVEILGKLSAVQCNFYKSLSNNKDFAPEKSDCNNEINYDDIKILKEYLERLEKNS